MENTTTIRRIADRLMRHPLMRDIPFETIIDYTIDFLQILGCPQVYIDKAKVLKIEDYRALLPCDYIEMVQVRNYIDPADLTSDRVYPIIYRYATDSFHLSDNKYESLNSQKEFTYTIQGSVIFTSLKEGYIEIVYRAIATDDEGYPLLPDHTKFLKALELYIKKEWFTKNKYEASEMGKANTALVFNFGPGQENYYIIDETLFKCLMEALNNKE